MGFLDKVKSAAAGGLEKGRELAAEGLEKSQELARTQQLKLELKKLDGQLDEAYSTLGRHAFSAIEADTLSTETLAADADAVRSARAAIDVKQAEIDGVGAEGA